MRVNFMGDAVLTSEAETMLAEVDETNGFQAPATTNVLDSFQLKKVGHFKQAR